MFISSRNKIFHWILLSLISIAFIVASGNTFAIVIKASAQWNALPVPVTPQTESEVHIPMVNGDFTITNGNNVHLDERGYIIGEGINESTDWSFDFTSDPAWSLIDFNSPVALTSSILTLTLIPRGLPDPAHPNDNWAQLNDFCTDSVYIHGISGSVPVIDNISSCTNDYSFNVQTQIIVDMFDYQQNGMPVNNIANIILGKLKNNQGLLNMRYNADAILEKAEMTMVVSNIPEPATSLLIALGLAGLGLRKKQQL